MIANRIRKDAPKADSPGSVTIGLKTSDKTIRLGNDQVFSDQVVVAFSRLSASSVSESDFIADADYELVGVRAVFRAAGGASAAVDVEKLTGTQAPGGGATMLTGTIALTGTANTVLTGTVHGTQATRRVASGNRIGLKLSGTLTGLAGLAVTVILKRV